MGEINNVLIESRRKELKYTNKDLAISLGYKTESAVRAKIKGTRKWSASDIRKLIDVLDISYEELYIN
jgi:hypothetical protein